MAWCQLDLDTEVVVVDYFELLANFGVHEHFTKVDDFLSHVHILQRLHWQLLAYFQVFFFVLGDLSHLVYDFSSTLLQLRA